MPETIDHTVVEILVFECKCTKCGYGSDHGADCRCVKPRKRGIVQLRGVIAWARREWRNDGAEGETVHALCDALESRLDDARNDHPPPCDECGAPAIESHLDHVVGTRLDYCPDHTPQQKGLA